MKKISNNHSKKNQANAQTQTDFSDLFLIEKLKEKEKTIKKLQQDLSFYKQRINLSSPKASSAVCLQQIPEGTSTEKTLKSFSSHRSVKRVPLAIDPQIPIVQYRSKSPVVQLDNENYALASRSNPRISRRRVKNQRITESSASIIRIYRGPPFKSGAIKKLNKDPSLISDLVYNENQSPINWENLMNELRNDPSLFGQMLDLKVNKKQIPETESNLRQTKKTISRRSAKSFYRDSRPLSGITRHTRPTTAKQEKFETIDWSKSPLEDQIANKKDSPKEDSQTFSYKQVEEMLISKNFDVNESVLQRAEKTIEKLKHDLMLPKVQGTVLALSLGNIENLLETCSALFKVRALVVKILNLIHQREALMLTAISADSLGAESGFKELEKIGQEIVQTIAFYKLSKFPVKEFVYLGENYEEKVRKDNESFKNLYPGIRNTEIFEDFNC